jgi:50S ribosomal subunit-associated GTPase HflX
MILLIFANRASNPISMLEIELAWLSFARTSLVRTENNTFIQYGNIFKSSFFSDKQEVEIVSAKQRGGVGSMQGGGETQLELEKQKI